MLLTLSLVDSNCATLRCNGGERDHGRSKASRKFKSPSVDVIVVVVASHVVVVSPSYSLSSSMKPSKHKIDIETEERTEQSSTGAGKTTGESKNQVGSSFLGQSLLVCSTLTTIHEGGGINRRWMRWIEKKNHTSEKEPEEKHGEAGK